MLIEQRTYTLQPGAMPRFLAAYESLGFAAHRDIYERLVGYFVSETGTLNQIVHIWAFDSFEDRNARREPVKVKRLDRKLLCLAEYAVPACRRRHRHRRL